MNKVWVLIQNEACTCISPSMVIVTRNCHVYRNIPFSSCKIYYIFCMSVLHLFSCQNDLHWSIQSRRGPMWTYKTVVIELLSFKTWARLDTSKLRLTAWMLRSIQVLITTLDLSTSCIHIKWLWVIIMSEHQNTVSAQHSIGHFRTAFPGNACKHNNDIQSLTFTIQWSREFNLYRKTQNTKTTQT